MIRLMGKIVDNGKTVGYAIIDMDSNKGAMCNIETTKTYVHTIGCVNAVVENGELKGTEASLSRLPEFNTDGNLVDKPKVSITGSLEKNGVTVGFMIMTPTGNVAKLSYEKSIEAIRTYGATNAKLVHKDGKVIVSAIQGTFKSTQLDDAKPNNKDVASDWGTYEELSKNNDFVFRNCSFKVLNNVVNNPNIHIAKYAFPQIYDLNKKLALGEFSGLSCGSSYVILTGEELKLPDAPKGFRVVLVDDNNKAISESMYKAILKVVKNYGSIKKEIYNNVTLSTTSKHKAIRKVYVDKLSGRHAEKLIKLVQAGQGFKGYDEVRRLTESRYGCPCTPNRHLLLKYASNRLESLEVKIKPVTNSSDFIGNKELFKKMNKISSYLKGRNIQSMWGTVNAYELFNVTKEQVMAVLAYNVDAKMRYYNKPRIGILMDNYNDYIKKVPLLENMVKKQEIDGMMTYTEEKLQLGYNVSLNDLVILVMLANKGVTHTSLLLRGISNMNTDLEYAHLPKFNEIFIAQTMKAIKNNATVYRNIKGLIELDKNRVLERIGIKC